MTDEEAKQVEKEHLNGHDFNNPEMSDEVCIICGMAWYNVDGINRSDGKLDPCYGKPAPGTSMRIQDSKWMAAMLAARPLPIVLRSYKKADGTFETLATCPLFPSLSVFETDRSSALYAFEALLEDVVFDMIANNEKVPEMPEGIVLRGVTDVPVKPE